MAHSIINFGEQQQRFHDLDLSVACFLIIDQCKSLDKLSMSNLFDDWVYSISFSGSGCLDLNLDERLVTPEDQRILLNACQELLKYLDTLDETYPKDKLNELMDVAKIKLESDYRIDLIKDAIVRLIALIQP